MNRRKPPTHDPVVLELQSGASLPAAVKVLAAIDAQFPGATVTNGRTGAVQITVEVPRG
jgi:hypothetical protein